MLAHHSLGEGGMNAIKFQVSGYMLQVIGRNYELQRIILPLWRPLNVL